MADNVLSVAVNFVELHRYTITGTDPTGWLPVADSVRGVPAGKIVYVFMSLAGGPFQLLKACLVQVNGEIQEVSAADALQGKFAAGTLSPASQTASLPLGSSETDTRLSDTVQQSLVRYFFYVSRHAVDGSFLIDLAANPRPELQVVTLDKVTQSPAAIPVTDPLTIAETLSMDYAKARDAYVALCAPFAEQTADEQQATSDLIKQRLIAQILAQVFQDPARSPSSSFLQQPSDFLQGDQQDVAAADQGRDDAALDCITWFDGPLMTYARGTYGADGTSADWVPAFDVLVQCDAAVMTRLADSYRGQSFIRTKISSDFYLLREFVGRPTSPGGDVAKVTAVANKLWDVISKLWVAVSAIVVGLEVRTGPRLVNVGSIFTLQRVVQTYNTLFGDGLMTISTTAVKPTFVWKDTITGNVVDVVLDNQLNSIILKTNDGRVIALERAVASKPHPFTIPLFLKGIAVVNLAIAANAAFDALSKTGTQKGMTFDQSFTFVKLLGGMVDTASAFPQSIASLLKLTGRGVTFISLVGAVLTIATSFKDATDAYKNGDFDATFGAALSAAGGGLLVAGSIVAYMAGSLLVPVVIALNAVGLVLIVVGAIILSLCTDDDLDTFVKHCFLGTNATDGDPGQPSWAAAPFAAWADPRNGLDLQLQALFNLIFAYSLDSHQSLTFGAHEQLVLDSGAVPPGAVFQIDLTGNIQLLAGGPPKQFQARLLLDPADPRFSRGTAALAASSVVVNPGKIVIEAIPAGVDPNAGSLNNIKWSVLLLTGNNPLHPGAINPNQTALRGVPATVPASGTPAQLSAGSSALSTDSA